ncbi:MAG: hypothetical protein ACJART_002117 [Maribacter sp.]|jgi:hypothetical protein
MKFNPIHFLKMALTFFCIYLIAACSKDTDLLADYVLNNDDLATMITKGKVVDDTYSVSFNQSIILDVLNNDNFETGSNVSIINTTNPDWGTVEINEDNTLTYTPNNDHTEDTSESSENTDSNEETSEENTEDSFDYITKETNEDGSTSTEEGTVTVTNDESKIPTSSENVFFAATYGNNQNNGKSEAQPWSIQKAFSTAEAGDIVYIKAGNYSNIELVQTNNGTQENPIEFIGYKNQPGDADSVLGLDLSNDNEFDVNRLPSFVGNSNDGLYEGHAIFLKGNYIELNNIQITRFEMGILTKGVGSKLTNILIYNMGDFRDNVNGFDDYKGIGIRAQGKDVKVQNSQIVDCGAESLVLHNCQSCLVENVQIVSNNNTNPTDYYLLLTGGTSNSYVTNATVKRKSGLSHYGHGIVGKAGAHNNIITNSTVINTTIELSFSNVYENTIKNCTVTGMFYENDDSAGSIEVANGAHHNIFENITIDGVRGAIKFRDWRDNSGQSNDVHDAGNNNTYKNITVTNSLIAIHFDEFSKLEGNAWDNSFENCTFNGVERLFHVNRPNSGTKLSNCLIKEVNAFSVTSAGFDYDLNPNTEFNNNEWINIGFTKPD